jgi:hypothetical protein
MYAFKEKESIIPSLSYGFKKFLRGEDKFTNP